jgi:two-component system, cell cycle response regulator
MQAGKFSVAVLGFQQTERVFLNSAFGLSARRTPAFVPFDPARGGAPDVYLVDTKASEAVQALQRNNADRQRPAILIGEDNLGLGWPLLGRPLQLTALFQAFDKAIQTATPNNMAPAVPAPARKATPAVNEARASHAPRQEHAATAVMVKPKPQETTAAWVLVCDDSSTVREFMRQRLQPYRLNVDYAESGEQAIGLTGTKHYACVFLDVMMPGIDGYQVCKLIKSIKRVNKTAVIMLTGKTSPFDKIRGTMAGCDAYLTKPVNEDKLLEVINRYLPD